jgi:hypothetical protein
MLCKTPVVGSSVPVLQPAPDLQHQHVSQSVVSAKALGLWLALLCYVTPTLQATAIADVTPKSTRLRLASMTDEELMEVIVRSPEAAELVTQGVRTEEELLLGPESQHKSPQQAGSE